MKDIYSLFFQRGSEPVVDSYSSWGIVCLNVPFKVGGSTKELAKRDWFDEDGEDVFFPPVLRLKGYDAEFEFAYKGMELSTNPFDLGSSFNAIDRFKKYLLGVGGSTSSLKIYSPYSRIGRQGCYLLEMGSESPVVHTVYESGNLYRENVVTFKVKFRITDPVTDVFLSPNV